MCFFWQNLMQQVIVEGPVELISDEEADAYWITRERDSQLGAWASRQSCALERREILIQRLADVRERFMDQRVPRPRNWSGYRLVPERMEFWSAGWHRLHERVCYCKSLSGWTVTLLYP
jgi:pyridoxamine 5'-phosphate oxidase